MTIKSYFCFLLRLIYVFCYVLFTSYLGLLLRLIYVFCYVLFMSFVTSYLRLLLRLIYVIGVMGTVITPLRGGRIRPTVHYFSIFIR